MGSDSTDITKSSTKYEDFGTFYVFGLWSPQPWG